MCVFNAKFAFILYLVLLLTQLMRVYMHDNNRVHACKHNRVLAQHDCPKCFGHYTFIRSLYEILKVTSICRKKSEGILSQLIYCPNTGNAWVGASGEDVAIHPGLQICKSAKYVAGGPTSLTISTRLAILGYVFKVMVLFVFVGVKRVHPGRVSLHSDCAADVCNRL